MKTIIQSIALLCAFAVNLFALEAIQLGDDTLGMRSVEQVLDDGGVAAIATPVSMGSEDFRGAYLVRESGTTMLSPYKNMPDPLSVNWYRTAQNLVGKSDGSAFWCLSYDQTGDNGFGDYIHYYDKDNSSASAISGVQKIYLYGKCDGGDAVVTSLLYGGTAESRLGSFDKQAFSPSGEAFTLPDNSGLNPAVTSDLQTIFYLAKGEGENLILRKYDIGDGETEDLVVIGDWEKLGLFNGKFLIDQHAVCCSADGGVVVYRYQETNEVKLGIAVEQDDGTYQCQVLDGTLNATAPGISANGQFVVYRQNGCIYRYDLQNAEALLVSSENQALTTAQPLVSPNGRYVSYLDDGNLLWRGDCGASIEITASDAEQVVGQNASAELAFEVNGATDSTVISWSIVTENGELPGTIRDYEGTDLQPNTAYSVASLPWYFQASESGGTCEIRLTADSYSAELTIVVSDFLNLTKASEAEFVCKFENLEFTDATNLYTETNVWGSAQSDTSPWNYDIVKQKWTATSQIDPKNGVFSSVDGATKAWVDENGTLKVSFCRGEESIDYATGVAELCGMSRDGREMVYKTTDNHFYGGNVPWNVKYELTGIPSNASNVVYAENGRCVMWTAVPDGESKACLYRMDVDVLGKKIGTPVCLTPEVVRDVLAVAVAPSAQYAAVTTVADLENGGKTTAENLHVNLFQWTDGQWENSTPYFRITSFGEMEEDTTKEFGLHMSDDDGDAMVPGIVTGFEHGTAEILPPSSERAEYQLRYTPEANFYGTDKVKLSVSDGTTTRTSTISVTVKNVNDPPVWDDEQTPGAVEMGALETKVIKLLATDVDDDTPTYSLAEGAPTWTTVSGDTLTLAPGLADAGTVTLTAQVSDGTVVASKTITVTVTAGEAEIPVEVLLDASKAPKTPTTYGEHLQVTVAGCWEGLAAGKWHALSLPGTAKISTICSALECDSIYLYQDGKYQAVASGTLPAGTGFWAKPAFTDGTAVIPLTPDEGPTDGRFIGPAWLDDSEDAPGDLFQEKNSAWQQTAEWSYGLGYFR